jgi:hypothetical protein
MVYLIYSSSESAIFEQTSVKGLTIALQYTLGSFQLLKIDNTARVAGVSFV